MRYLILAAALCGLPVAASAQAVGSPRIIMDDEWCDDGVDRDRGRYCEVREFTIPAPSVLAVDARPNGGIQVTGGARSDVFVRAKVQAWARSDADAEDLARDVTFSAESGRVMADGPAAQRREGWAVSFRIEAPRRLDLDLESQNGGIGISDVVGRIRFVTTNGGVDLDGVSGDVQGETTNGGLDIALAGSRWEGAGLDVRTTNGGVRLSIPEDYSARLETGTVNGGMDFDFPITVQGRVGRRLTTDLGQGGTAIRAYTTNGGVVLRRR